MGEPDRGVARRGRSPDASERVQTFALLEVDRAPRRNVRHDHSDAHRYDDDKGEKKLDQCGPFLIHPLLTSSSGPKQKPDCCGESSHGNPVPVGLPYNFGNPAVSLSQETRGFPSPPHDGFGFIDFPYHLYLIDGKSKDRASGPLFLQHSDIKMEFQINPFRF